MENVTLYSILLFHLSLCDTLVKLRGMTGGKERFPEFCFCSRLVLSLQNVKIVKFIFNPLALRVLPTISLKTNGGRGAIKNWNI